MKRRRGSSRYYFIFVFLVCVLIGAIFGARSIIKKLSFFEIEKIVIKGNENLETAFLENLVKDYIGQNLFQIEKRDIRKKYENIIRIKAIKVSRIIPDKLKIAITERKGVIFIKTTEGELFPIDDEKIILDNDNFYTNEVLPIVSSDIDKRDIIYGEILESTFIDSILTFYRNLLDIHPIFKDKISELYRKDNEIIIVEAEKGYRILFGKDDLENKIKRFLLIEGNRTFERNSVVDLRFENKLIVRTEER
ncbi:MAG: FtsQ-type POTRA domain-containing protein [Candidatus Cloacimonetes bacterium]|nr:FtsQ-type POTRA domain-containing protein [Candidatus Cloacimonadota bacterium]